MNNVSKTSERGLKLRLPFLTLLTLLGGWAAIYQITSVCFQLLKDTLVLKLRKRDATCCFWLQNVVLD